MGEREIRRAVRELGFPGVKVHFGEFRSEKSRLPTYNEVASLFGTIADLGVPALVDIAGAIDMAEMIPPRHPLLKLVIAHLGSPRDPAVIDRVIELCCSHANVWMDCSYCFVPEKIPEAIQRCGTHKIIFGSDGPSNSIDIADLVESVRAYGLPMQDEARILGGNIRHLLADHWTFD